MITKGIRGAITVDNNSDQISASTVHFQKSKDNVLG